MMDQREIEAYLAEHYPHAHHLFADLNTVFGIIKTQNRGKGHVSLDAQGIDIEGKVIVKCIETGLKFFRQKDEQQRNIG
jgi:hypothetical protein